MDIVKLLRTRPLYESYGEESSIPDDAAAEIERLRKILEDVLETSGEQIPYGTVKAIRSALKEKE